MAILRSRLVSGNSPGSDGAVGIEQEHGPGGVAVVANVAADQSRPIDPETIASVVLGTKRKPENKFRLFQSCQNSAKNFRCAFFQLAGTEELCLHPAKMSAKSFRCAIFQLAGTGGNVWTLWHGMTLTSVSWGCRSPISIFSYS